MTYYEGQVKTCYKELPVEFEFRGEKLNGFINQQKIINLQAKKVVCEIESDIILTETTSIRRQFKFIRSTNISSYHKVDANPVDLRFCQINLEHPKAIITGQQ